MRMFSLRRRFVSAILGFASRVAFESIYFIENFEAPQSILSLNTSIQCARGWLIGEIIPLPFFFIIQHLRKNITLRVCFLKKHLFYEEK